MRRWGIVGAWLVVVALTTTMTWQIVSAADNRINRESSPPLNIGAPLPGATITEPPAESTTTTFPKTSITTTPPGGSSSSSSSTSTSSVPPAAAETVVIPTAGGTVTVKVSPGSVSYVSAVPHPGFAVEVEDAGPPKVRVEFESKDSRLEVRAEWENGQLDVEIDVDD
ncbi:MAG: hypothetical protein WD269_01205 [Acidimicrobiia bacterium]